MKQSCFLSNANIWHHAHRVTDNNIYTCIYFSVNPNNKKPETIIRILVASDI